MKQTNLLLLLLVVWALPLGAGAQTAGDNDYFNQMGHYPTTDAIREFTIADFDSAIKAEPQNPYPYCSRGELKIIDGHFKQGNADIDSAISIADMKIKIHFFEEKEKYIFYGKAHLYYTFPQVLEIYDKAIALFPDSTIVYWDRCGYYSRHKMFKKAMADARKVLEINPSPQNYEGIASMVLYYSNEYPTEEILKVYNEWIQHYPNTGRSYLCRGDFYEKKASLCVTKQENKKVEIKKERIGWYKKAISDYDTAIRLEPSSNQFKLALIACNEFAHICSPTKILKLYDEYINGESGVLKISGYLSRANYCESIHEYGQSVADMDSLIQMRPTNWVYYLGRARIESYLGVGKKNEVESDLQKAKALSIGHGDINKSEEYRRLQKIYGN